jgi:hypothetical protein
MVGVSPSSSEAVAEQVNAVDVSTPVLGLMLTEETSGFVLSTVTESEPVSVPPSSSVAVAVQVMVSSGEFVEVESVSDAPEPKLVPSEALVQA